MLKFYVEGFRTISEPYDRFGSCLVYVYVWNDDIYWSKILCSNINTTLHDLKVKVTDLEL